MVPCSIPCSFYSVGDPRLRPPIFVSRPIYSDGTTAPKLNMFGYFNHRLRTMTRSIQSTVTHVILLTLLIVIGSFHLARGIEYFQCTTFDAGVLSDLSSRPAPFVSHPSPSVFSSLPPHNRINSAYKYLAPYQSACLSSSSSSSSSSCTRDRDRARDRAREECLTCDITPHNQRYCRWR